jgi:hypothetical protein
LAAIGDEAGEEIDQEVARAAMAGVFDPAAVLALIADEVAAVRE